MTRRLFAVVLLLVLISINPASALVFSQSANNTVTDNEAVFNDITCDFQLFRDVLASNDIHNRTEAVSKLSPGFNSKLAASIVDCYLQYEPDLGYMTVIPMECIPIITPADRSYCQITMLNDHTARLDRIYSNCYSPDDCWLYQITAEKFERWKIADLNLIPIISTCFPSNP